MNTGSENVEKQSCGSERRRFHRKNVLERQLVTTELGGGRIAILIDVSEDGIAVQPFRPLSVGTRVTLEFDLPRAGGHIVGEGSVVWVARTGRAGIRFSQLTQRSWCSLDEWLRVVEDPLAEAIRDYSSGDALSLDMVLDLITERACTATRAEGSAFVVQAASGFVCCSSVGNAPDPGILVKPRSLTGESLRFGITLNCGDIANDVRSNEEIRENCFASSALVVPILAGERAVAGIEVLSSALEAFTERDAGRLKRLAETAAPLANELSLNEAAGADSAV